MTGSFSAVLGVIPSLVLSLSFTHSLIHSLHLTRSLPPSLTHSLTHSLTLSTWTTCQLHVTAAYFVVVQACAGELFCLGQCVSACFYLFRRAFSLRYVVRRSKKCMDFTVTLFLVHVLLCTVTKGLPTCWQWWLLNVLTAGVMVVLGEWLCLRQEVSEIPLSVGASNSASNKQSSK